MKCLILLGFLSMLAVGNLATASSEDTSRFEKALEELTSLDLAKFSRFGDLLIEEGRVITQYSPQGEVTNAYIIEVSKDPELEIPRMVFGVIDIDASGDMSFGDCLLFISSTGQVGLEFTSTKIVPIELDWSQADLSSYLESFVREYVVVSSWEKIGDSLESLSRHSEALSRAQAIIAGNLN